MSLRKFMHPKNKYKNAPDFKQLALLYPEFRKIAFTDLKGKVHVDFKNEEHLRVLTEVLLKHDFNLSVKIPPDKLVPTLPLRLNYVLWIEDLLTHNSFMEMKDAKGIDIGCGAVCIYPLLLAQLYKCHVIGTEVDETSIQSAVENIKNNNLQDLIQVKKVSNDDILKNIIGECESFHFVMCNPPFFETDETFDKSIKQQPPRNAPTGNKQELTTQGGEQMFVIKMIKESMQILNKIKIYTTMLGKKRNLLFFIKAMKNYNIANFTWTEFCQGHTKRWGLAWSFLFKDILDLAKVPVIRETDLTSKFMKNQSALQIVFIMQNRFSSINDVIETLKNIINELQLTMKELNFKEKDVDSWGCQLIAKNDTWSHARRKRRLAERQSKWSDVQDNEDHSDSSITKEHAQVSSNIAERPENTEKNPLLIFNLFVELLEDEYESEKNMAKLSLFFDSGSGGKSALENFRQFLVNRLNVREDFQQFCLKDSKKRKRIKKVKKKQIETNISKEKGKPNTSSDEESVDST